MTQQDFTLLRAKDYDNTVIVNRKKMYICHFCQYQTSQFSALKIHIKDSHLESTGQSIVNSPSKLRSMSSDSVVSSRPLKNNTRCSSVDGSRMEVSKSNDH